MSDIGLPRGMSRDDAYIQGMADGEKAARVVVEGLLSTGIEDVDLNSGILECRYCGETNAMNEPPEDDAIRHAEDCAGVAAQDWLAQAS